MRSVSNPGRFSKGDRLLIGVFLVALAAVYLSLHNIYRRVAIDDAWFLSFAYNHVVRGIETDAAFGTVPGGGGYGGVLLFGKTYTLLYGHVLELVGWTKSNAHLISTVCIFLGALLWARILPKLGFSRRLSVFAGLSLPLVEPLFSSANSARPDALSFLIVSASFLAYLHRRPVLAGFLAVVAIEIHPVGLFALLLAGSFEAAQWAGRQESPGALSRLLRLGAGLGTGGLYYLALHAPHLSMLASALSQGNSGAGVNNILFEYFFKTQYYRHIPELILFAACAAVFMGKRYHRENAALPALVVASLLFTLIVRRPNYFYVVYVYPALLLLYFWVFERHGRLRLACILLLAYLLPQYAVVFRQNRHWNMETYLGQVRARADFGGSPIMGNANDFFAFPGRPYFYSAYPADFAAVAPESLVLVEDETFRVEAAERHRGRVRALYEPVAADSFQSRGQTVVVRKLVKRPDALPGL